VLRSLMQCAELIQCFIMAYFSWGIEMYNPGLGQTTGLSSVDLITYLQVMEAVHSSETLVPICQSTCHHIPEGSCLHSHYLENLISQFLP
jgi:hypothetical protein